MLCLRTLDVALFRFINQTLSNPLFDAVMPWLSGNRLFLPLVLLVAAGLIWRGRGKGVLFILLLALVVGVTDGLVGNPLKHALGRVRPCTALEHVRVLVGCSGSMPSNQAANWFAAAMVAFLFHRRSCWVMLPLAVAVCFSRIYNGVHYPSDVLVGAIVGAGAGFTVVFMLNATWRYVGQKWFPLWHESLPSLVPRGERNHRPPTPLRPHSALRSRHWITIGCSRVTCSSRRSLWRDGYTSRVALSSYLRTRPINGVWSKHLALSY